MSLNLADGQAENWDSGGLESALIAPQFGLSRVIWS
jgi:hypothetical protein